MDIISYLIALVETRKMVGIKALGTLYKKKTPGRYDIKTNLFLPPKQELAFTTDVKEEEALANFISEQRNISIDSANYYIAEFVEQIKAQLQDHQHANFFPFGDLRLLNEEIIFEPAANEQFNLDYYGLPSVSNDQQTLINNQDDIKLEGHLDNYINHEDNLQIEVNQQENNLETASSQNEIDQDETSKNEVIKEGNLDNKIDQDENSKNEVIKEGNLDNKIDQEDNKKNIVTQDESLQNYINQEDFLQNEIKQEEHLQQEKEAYITTLPADKNTIEQIDPTISVIAGDKNDIPPVWTGMSDDDDDEDDENTGRGKRILLKTLLVLFLILIAGAVTYFLYPDLFDRFQNNNQDSISEAVPVETIDTASNKNIDSLIADSIKKNIALALHKDSLLNITSQNKIVYEVIASAMKSQKKVLEVSAILEKRGLIAKKMDALPGRLIKISVGTFTDYNLAKKFQDSLKIKLRNPDIYIQTVKPKK